MTDGTLEVNAEPGAVRLFYAPGAVEIGACLVSAVALVGVVADAALRRRRSAPRE